VVHDCQKFEKRCAASKCSKSHGDACLISAILHILHVTLHPIIPPIVFYGSELENSVMSLVFYIRWEQLDATWKFFEPTLRRMREREREWERRKWRSSVRHCVLWGTHAVLSGKWIKYSLCPYRL
jgi:hypothetical protein